jgi:aspartate-semialdehyde dehydrogenase
VAASRKTKFRCAVVGSETLRGREIKSVLSVKKFPLQSLEFYDPDVGEEDSKLTQFRDEPKIVHHLDRKALEGLDLVFLAADARTNAEYGECAAALHYRAIELRKDAGIADLESSFRRTDAIKLAPAEGTGPISPVSVAGKDKVFVGQIKKAETIPGGFWIWAVADNLTLGSALNAYEIARSLFKIS